MKKKGSYFFFLWCAVVFFACQGDGKPKVSIMKDGLVQVSFEKDQAAELFDLSTIYKSGIKLLTLKASGGAIIGSVDKVLIHGNRIYVLDKAIAEALFIFDIEGNLLARITIGERGRELLSLVDFCIEGEVLYVLDDKSGRVGKYDLGGIKTIGWIHGLPNNISNIAAIDGHLLCYRDLVDDWSGEIESSTLFLIDQKGNIKKHWLPIDKRNAYLTRYVGDGSVLKKRGDQVYISRLMDDYCYVYSADDTSLSQRVRIDFGDFGIPDHLKIGNSDTEFVKSLTSGGYHYSMSGYVETDRFLYFHINRGQEINSVFIDKSSNKKSVISSFRYGDSQVPIFQMNTIESDYCISVIPLEIMASIKIQLSKAQGASNDDEFATFITEFDVMNGNPVLAMMSN